MPEFDRPVTALQAAALTLDQRAKWVLTGGNVTFGGPALALVLNALAKGP